MHGIMVAVLGLIVMYHYMPIYNDIESLFDLQKLGLTRRGKGTIVSSLPVKL